MIKWNTKMRFETGKESNFHRKKVTKLTVGALARLQSETRVISNFCVSRQYRPDPIFALFRK